MGADTRSPLVTHPEPEVIAAIDAIVEAAVQDGFAGGVTMIRDGRIVYDRVAGFSDVRGTVIVGEATLFHVASISKYLTALVVLRSVDAGKISLDEPVAPWAPGTRLAGRKVTWLDLLSHRAGLASSYVAERIADADDALAAIDDQPIDQERVGRFRYSNDGYDLLAILLERVWDRPFERLAREQVLNPSGLDGARFWAEVDLRDPGTVGQPLRKVPRKLRKRNYGMLGSAGLLTTARDLVRLEMAVSGGGLLTADSSAALRRPRGSMSLGDAALGSFLMTHPELGLVYSMRGYEDWGDNAILNHYRDRGVILAVVTSKGPAEETDQAPFRSRISQEIEAVLVARLKSR